MTSIEATDSATRSRRSNKRVSFPSEDDKRQLAQVVCTLPHREDFTDDDLHNLFFSRNDYQMSRSSARVVSKESERYGFSKSLDETYCEKSSAVQERLNEWAVSGHSRRGLERWANSKHGEERQQDQFQAIMTVLRCQDDMIARNNSIDVDKLRKVAHKATKTSRHFARMMGKADSYAMAQELRNEQEEEKSTATEMATEAMSCITVASDEDMTVTIIGDVPIPSLDDVSVDVEPHGGVDELKDSHHEKFRSLRRFGFGRKSSNRNSGSSGSAKDGARVSRVA